MLASQFKVFWKALQPDWRQTSSWPLPKDAEYTQLSDWSRLIKGGPNGFFLVLKTLSFWAKMAWTTDERKEFELAMEEVNWVAGEMLKQLNGGSVIGRRRTKRIPKA